MLFVFIHPIHGLLNSFILLYLICTEVIVLVFQLSFEISWKSQKILDFITFIPWKRFILSSEFVSW